MDFIYLLDDVARRSSGDSPAVEAFQKIFLELEPSDKMSSKKATDKAAVDNIFADLDSNKDNTGLPGVCHSGQ